MTTSRGPVLRHALLAVMVVGVAAALTVPLAAGGKKDKSELPTCWKDMKRIFDKQPTTADRGFAFGYVETTLRAQWDPTMGIEEERCHPDGLRRILLSTTARPEPQFFFANGCERGQGFIFLASDLAPGEMEIKDVPYSVRGMDFFLTLPEPIRFEVVPSSAVFVGSFRIVAGPLFPNDPNPTQVPTVTLQTLETPTAAELAAEMAPVFEQRWRSYLEAMVPPAERRRTTG
jgi:hypothetical protein